MGLTVDLGLRLLGGMILSEDGRHKDREYSNEPTPAQDKHGKDSRNEFYEFGVLFKCWRMGELPVGVRIATGEMVHHCTTKSRHIYRRSIYGRDNKWAVAIRKNTGTMCWRTSNDRCGTSSEREI
jgi:hypothetical protein